jgi:hypothetical protein
LDELTHISVWIDTLQVDHSIDEARQLVISKRANLCYRVVTLQELKDVFVRSLGIVHEEVPQLQNGGCDLLEPSFLTLIGELGAEFKANWLAECLSNSPIS